MSNHSGIVGRKHSSSGDGREYYFCVGDPGVGVVKSEEQLVRRQRSAEWCSRHGYSSSEDEYQNITQRRAFDTQLLTTLLLQSQQLANTNCYSSDTDAREPKISSLIEYPDSSRDQSSATLYYEETREHLQENLNSALCSPNKRQQQTPTALSASVHRVVSSVATTTITAIDANNSIKYNNSSNDSTSSKYLSDISGDPVPAIARSTNPFLNPKYDSAQSNSGSLRERLSYRGGSVIQDHVQTCVIGTFDFSISKNRDPYLLPVVVSNCGTCISASSTTSNLPNAVCRDNSWRPTRSKNACLDRSSSIVSSISATSPDTTIAPRHLTPTLSSVSSVVVESAMSTVLAIRNEREKLKLRQIQMELHEYAQGDNAPTVSDLTSAGKFEANLLASGADSDPPPEPAPPEIPPRTQSLLMSLRKSTNFKLKYEEKDGDQKHEEFIPTSQLPHLQHHHEQLKRDCSVSGNSRSSGQSKSAYSDDSPGRNG